MVEITYRTFQGRLLLRPGEALNRLLVGVLAKALSLYPGRVGLVGIVVLSNHLHLLLKVEDQHALSKLMEYFGGNAAREVNRLHDWAGSLWGGRYTSICVTTEERAQVARLEYLLAQGVKEGLVAKVSDWPGIHFGKTLLEGRSLISGEWIDRTRLYRATRRGKQLERSQYVEELTVELQPLPCWSHLPWGEYIRRIEEIVERIEARAALERDLAGAEVLGAEAVEARDPHHRPGKIERRPAPVVHGATKRERRRWQEAYGFFLDAYRAAAKRLREGEGDVKFPEGCFPPGLPYVWPGCEGTAGAEPAPAEPV